MPDNNELVNILRAAIQEELNPVTERLSALEVGQQELRQDVRELRQGVQELRQGVQELRQGVQELKKGQAAVEAAVNDLRTINRRTHKEIFSQLNAIWDDIKLLSSKGEKAVR